MNFFHFCSEKTRIVSPPRSQVVNASSIVTFTCNATTDPSEIKNLKIEWRRYDEVITNSSDKRYSVSDNGHHLEIKDVEVIDSGSYACHASSSLDSDTVTVTLTIQGTIIYAIHVCFVCFHFLSDPELPCFRGTMLPWFGLECHHGWHVCVDA